MEASLRPWFTTGVALVGASAIAMAPISPITLGAPVSEVRAVTATVSADLQLAAVDWPYVLSLPIVREQIRNWAQNWGVYLAGLGKAGIGVVDSLLAIPGVTVEIIQEIFALNFVGAFDTFATAVRDSVIAIGQPLLDSVIWRNQKYLVVQAALESAVPRAWIDLANGFLAAGNVVTTSLIQGTQDFVAAVLTFNLSNIIDATVEGTKNFFIALGDGAGSIIAGIEAAQRGIVTALATPPPPPPTFEYQVSDVAALRTLSVDNTVSLAGKQGVDTAVVESPITPVDETKGGAEVVVDPVAVAEPVVAPVVAPEPEHTTGPVTTPVGNTTDDETDAVDPPKTTPDATPDKDTPKDDEDTVTKVTPKADKSTGAEKGAGATNDAGPKKDAEAKKDAGAKNDAGAKKDAGSDTKSGSGSDE